VLLNLWHTAAMGSWIDTDVLHSKRAGSSCTSSPYTTPDGLSFAVQCNSNIPGNDFEFPTSLTTVDVYDCMRHCSVARPECFGISFNVPNGFCYLKNSSVVGTYIDGTDTSTNSALVTPTSQLSSADTTCPFGNQTSHTSDNGMEFLVSCGLDIRAGDYCPPAQNSSCRWHASSLTDCMNQCSTSHPLCTGVSYNPDMVMGYANCYPKNNFASQGFMSGESFVTHSAVAAVKNITVNCVNNGNLTASNNKAFNTQCNQNRAGNDLTVYHEISLQNCINNCGTYTGCVGVIFDGNMELGWENCYLKSATGTPLYNSTATFALVTGVKDATSTSGSSTPGSSGSSGSSASKGNSGSKAWIAGVVVAVIVVLALIAGFAIWWRRRQANGAGTKSMGHAHEAGYQEQHYHADPKYVGSVAETPLASSDNSLPKSLVHEPPVELADTQMSELQGSGK